MPAPAIGVRPGVQPGPSAQIDWSHPLSQGLVCYFLLNGRAPVDLVGGVTLTLTAAASISPLGLVCTSNNANASVTTPTHLRLSQLMSIGCGFLRAASTASNGAGLFGTTYTNTDTTPYVGAMFDTASNTKLGFSANSNGSAAPGATGGPDVRVGYNVALGRVEVGASNINQIRLNDATTANSASRNNPPAYAADSKLYVGSYPPVTNRNPQAIVQWAAIWSRIVTDAEYAMLRADPYCFLRY